MTEAASSTARSAGRSCSMRAASAAWIVGGSSIPPASTVALPLLVDAPQNAVVDEQAQQLAKEQRISFARFERPREHPGTGSCRSSSKSSAMRCPGGRHRADRGGRHDRKGPRPRRTQRVAHAAPAAPNASMQQRRPRAHSAMCSIRSSNAGSAHCMSSTRSTTGRLPGQRFKEPAQGPEHLLDRTGW